MQFDLLGKSRIPIAVAMRANRHTAAHFEACLYFSTNARNASAYDFHPSPVIFPLQTAEINDV